MEHADTAFYMGMIDMSQHVQISVMQLRAAQLISDGLFICKPYPALLPEACAGRQHNVMPYIHLV